MRKRKIKRKRKSRRGGTAPPQPIFCVPFGPWTGGCDGITEARGCIAAVGGFGAMTGRGVLAAGSGGCTTRGNGRTPLLVCAGAAVTGTKRGTGTPGWGWGKERTVGAATEMAGLATGAATAGGGTGTAGRLSGTGGAGKTGGATFWSTTASAAGGSLA